MNWIFYHLIYLVVVVVHLVLEVLADPSWVILAVHQNEEDLMKVVGVHQNVIDLTKVVGVHQNVTDSMKVVGVHQTEID